MHFRSAYDHEVLDPETGEVKDYAFHTTGPSRTKQSMKDECDINNIVARFQQGENITHVAKVAGAYADVSAVGDYRTAIENVRAVEEMFLTLSAEDRAKFDNDPAMFLDAIQAGQVEIASEDAVIPEAAAEPPPPEISEAVSPEGDTA